MAVAEASCAVYPGQLIALVGPSGSGKSTLLHLLGGLDTPTSGSVTWPGIGPIDRLRPAHVAHIFQGPSLLPPFTVLQNVRLPLMLAGIDDHAASLRALEALRAFEVEHLQDKLPEEISGGQAQRVSIARAVAIQPELILADEPTGQLDSVTAKRAMDELFGRLSELDIAMVLATHDPEIAEQCDVRWTMRDGRLHAGNSWTAPVAYLLPASAD